MSGGATRATAPIHSVVRRGGAVFAGLRRTYEPSLWRRELATQLRMLVTGRLAGRGEGRDHAGIAPRRYSARTGASAVWLRHGTGDAAVWGEVYVRGVYAAPWPVPAGLRVLDLGGHIGLFARWALDEWDAQSVLSVEPDPGNAEVLQRNLGELNTARWRVEIAAAACAEGTAPFAGGRGAGSALGAGGEDTVRTIDAIPLLAECDLAKIDIEGGEWSLLGDPRFAAVAPQMIVVEHHPAAEVGDPAARARGLLEAAGYDVVAGQAEEDVSGVGVLWGLRRPR